MNIYVTCWYKIQLIRFFVSHIHKSFGGKIIQRYLTLNKNYVFLILLKYIVLVITLLNPVVIWTICCFYNQYINILQSNKIINIVNYKYNSMCCDCLKWYYSFCHKPCMLKLLYLWPFIVIMRSSFN